MSDGPDGAAAGEPVGTVYLIHLDPAYKHARHYTGWSANLEQRLEEHRAGIGARLLDVVQKAGGSWHLVRTWRGTRELERAIKDMRAVPQLCPECSPHPLPLTRGRAARLVRDRADPVPQPPRRRALPGPAAALPAERQASPEPERVPVPDPREPVPSVFPGRPASPEVYRSLWDVTDRLISGWRAELDAGTGLPSPAPGRPSPGAAAARAALLRPGPDAVAEATPMTTPYAHPDDTSPSATFQPSPYDAGITDDPELTWAQVRALPEAQAEAEAAP